MARSRVSRLLSDQLFLLGLTWAALLIVFFRDLRAFDLWLHLKSGELILATRRIPFVDAFSFTAAGRPWTYHSWLSGVVLAGVWSLGGTIGLVALRSLVIGASLLMSWVLARMRGVNAGLASVLVLCAALQLKVRALVRPFAFSFLFFMIFAIVLQAAALARPAAGREGRRRGRPNPFAAEDSYLWGSGGRLLLLPLLTVLWANMHAGFLVGLLLIGAFGAGEMLGLLADRRGVGPWDLLMCDVRGARFRAMLVAGVCCLGASVVTPYGPGVLFYPFRLVFGVKLLGVIKEWKPTPWHSSFCVFWAVLVLGALVLVRSACSRRLGGTPRGRLALLATDLFLFGGFCLMAVRTVRNLAWVLLLMPAIVGANLHLRRDERTQRARRVLYAHAAIVLALVLGPISVVAFGVPSPDANERRLPVKAADFMDSAGLDSRFFNAYEWGGYLIWRFWPARTVFVDGRCLVYRDDLLQQTFDVEQGKDNWERVLDRWQVDMFLIRYGKRDSSHFLASTRWACVYWDDTALIGLRRGVFEAHRPALPELGLSNPLQFESAIETEPPERILAELDIVRDRAPQSWRERAFRARCLVRMARQQPGRRDELLGRAFECAREGLKRNEASHDTWRAVQEVAEELGEDRLAELGQAGLAQTAAENARKFLPEWVRDEDE